MAVSLGAACTNGQSDDAGSVQPDEDDLTLVEVGEPEPEVDLTVEELERLPLPPVPSPDEAIAGLGDEGSDRIEEAVNTDAVDLLAAVSIDRQPSDEEIAGFGDGRPRTATGRLIGLDEAASLACANVEQAVWAIDVGDLAAVAGRVEQAIDWANKSELTELDEWAEVLGGHVDSEAAVDPVTLVAFLGSCIDAGYEL